MTPSNFHFLEKEYPILYNIGQSAEYHLHEDPITCLFKIRQLGERLSELLFEEHGLKFPTDNTFHNRIKKLEFDQVLPYKIKDLFFFVKEKGNAAVHQNKGSLSEGKQALASAFKLAKRFYQTYSRNDIDILRLEFTLPEARGSKAALLELENQYKSLEERFNQLLAQREVKQISEEKQKVIETKSQKAANKIEMSEEETRELIDAQLRLAGWGVDTQAINYKLHKSLPQRNRYRAIAEWPVGSKWADYALFIGTELYGLVEAKKYGQDISTNLRQSKIYAEFADESHNVKLLGNWRDYKAPFLFSANGRNYIEELKTKSGIWFLDVRQEHNTSRPLRGWYSPEGLQKLWEQDIKEANAQLVATDLDFLESKSGLGLRKYQVKAIKAIERELIEKPEKKRSLIAMATGTGKTRTVIGLCYHLIKSNRFNRILFLVDRTLLGIQAMNAFKDNKVVGLNTFSEIYDVKELKNQLPDVITRLHFATVQGMVKRLFYNDSEERLPAVDQYDCIIIDEAHRGYLLDKEMDEEEVNFKNQQDYVSAYRQVLEYFDAYAIGLTATPALHTKEIFGSPVYTYSYREAVIDGYLIDHDPPHKIKTKLSEEGIKWEKGEKPKAYDKETNSIVELEELEDELHIDVSGFNKLVLSEKFNRTVVKELVTKLDPEGEAKTLIFAASDEHADTIVQFLKEEFQNIGIEVSDDAIQKITGKSYDPEELLKRYKNEKYPNIAVTVDLLTTGIDVPSICNIVFMRRVKSRILYEQMLGRATRKCDDIGKESFQIYDAVRLYETLQDYSQMKPVVANPQTTFEQLTGELNEIKSEKRLKQQIEQIIGKLQRKKRYIEGDKREHFKYNSGGQDPDGFINLLREAPIEESISKIIQHFGLWKFLDELKPAPTALLVSEHDDEYLGTERGYGKGKKPEDFLESFAQYIKANQNKITALQVVCTRPKELSREDLRQLRIALDQEGYTERALNSAWKDAKNEDIAADMVSYIRTLAVGNALISHEERIKNAVRKVRKMRQWNAVQLKWIDRFEKQLLKETVLRAEDLDEEPFKGEGGYERLNKIFENQLEIVINNINDNLYTQTA